MWLTLWLRLVAKRNGWGELQRVTILFPVDSVLPVALVDTLRVKVIAGFGVRRNFPQVRLARTTRHFYLLCNLGCDPLPRTIWACFTSLLFTSGLQCVRKDGVIFFFYSCRQIFVLRLPVISGNWIQWPRRSFLVQCSYVLHFSGFQNKVFNHFWCCG